MKRYSKLARASILTLAIASVGTLAACGSDNSSSTSDSSSGSGEGKVTLRFFSNLPDRKSGQGLAEQTVIDNYTKENPNVKIEVETLAEEPFKNKLKAYMSSNEPIDITMVHGGAELNTLVQAGYVKELNPKQYEGEQFNFLPGVYKSFTFNDKLYGLPRNSDYEVIYYNKKLFADNGVKVPTTLTELLDAAKAFRDKGIAPMSINGKDLWSFGEMYQNLVLRYSGNQNLILDAIDKKVKFADDENFLKAAQFLGEVRDAKMFQDSYMTADYGASQNMFSQGKAAMWYMGSWEAGMATNEALPEEFRQNLGVVKFPVAEDGKGSLDDLLAWNGGGYALVSSSKHPEEAKKFFDYLMSASQWAKVAWDTGAAVPAQKYELTGSESEVQKTLTDILINASSTSGASAVDYGTPKFKDDSQNAFGKFFSSKQTPEELLSALQTAVDNQ
ncbi:putative ABC transporter extracellular-binding protein YurO [Paenibacillus sp. CCS19]|uniref:ABC transporter substrate-binding protein n=1 Tax=Paenibacillus sp. CCS19 TaxID=3158387 RepID=UPI0025668500|nr:extracellular solute-binding protein [Paenibacillus cellulosilyticus]GMK37466.1 putative ABC transporter extracellular-binding protein YurO [Paenibacillus cellulosilyticus]